MNANVTDFEEWLKDAKIPSGATEEYKMRMAYEAGKKKMEKLLGKRVLELQADKGQLTDECDTLRRTLINLGHSFDEKNKG